MFNKLSVVMVALSLAACGYSSRIAVIRCSAPTLREWAPIEAK